MNGYRKICTIVGSDKGGVGKSMIATFKVLVHDKAGVPLTVIELDNQRKLSSALGPERVNLSLAASADLQEISRNRHAAESFYNPVYIEWTKGPSVTDLGANVTTALMSWFRQCDIAELAAEDDIAFQFVACASPDEQAIKSALTAICEAMDTLGPAEFYVVLNDLSGTTGFEPYQNNPSFRELLGLSAARKLQILQVPYCDSLLLEHGKAHGFNPLQCLEHADELASAANLDLVSARVHKKKLVNWMRDFQDAMKPLLSVEEPAYHAAPASAFAHV